MKSYDHKDIEKKWQEKWEADATYKTEESKEKEKFYVLDMFPYPSGEGLHVGHPKGYIATDVLSRMKRMQGYSVLHPMGWDAFGLPAENYAIKNKVHPRVAVEKNVTRFKEQLAHIGLDYDWSREINTTDPEYYKWSQWIFLKLLEKGLAFESYEPINWCPSCQTGLANEDLEDGKCERCGSVVEKKPMRQWVLRITDYADRLLTDLDTLPWPPHIKELQKNWIGRSEGAELTFPIRDTEESLTVFTTRPDTFYGVTYVVVAPEHTILSKLKEKVTNWKEVETYIENSLKKEEIERTAEGKEKTGVKVEGVEVIHPATGESLPVYVADYVLGSYGTGAVMAVPAHDERDYAFAKKYDLPIKVVISSDNKEEIYTGEGTLINSDTFSGLSSKEAREKITEVFGKKVVKYKLRDWVFSRQRYWGEPIPVIHCEKCGVVPVPENELPVRLPEVEHYEPTGTGESPLANITEWVNTTCPTCEGPAKRETNTMPQWAGSSWYYLRFMDPHNDEALVSGEKEKYWAPVDVYVGGAEHATRHLIYARFWHKFLYDIGVVSTLEPFMELHSVGLVMAEDGRKMSKRYGNVINPDDVIERFGADSLRLYEMFMGPFDNTIAWNTDNLVGVRRFIERVWYLQSKVTDDAATNPDIEMLLHKTIKKVTEDIQAFKFNTAISSMMEFVNALSKETEIPNTHYALLLQLLAPFAPHMTEEVWYELGNKNSIHTSLWPVYDESKLVSRNATIIVQVNGKVRGSLEVETDAEQKKIEIEARKIVEKWLLDKEVKKIIFVQNKLINFVAV